MKLKVLLSLLAILMPLVVWADASFWEDPVFKVIYKYYSGSGVACVYCGGGVSDIVILDRFIADGNEYVVTSIGYSAFLGDDEIVSVTIPNTVKTIEGNAFNNCTGLMAVHFEDNSVTNIENRAFVRCRSLTSIDFPNSLTYIGDAAFESCYNLKDVKLPNSLTTIDTYAFNECGLSSITIPKSVKCIKTCAFACESLNDVHVFDLTAWCNIEFNGVNANPLSYAKHLYLNNKEITDVEIPEGTTCISDYAFYNFSGMTSIKIPNTVTSIGEEAFRNCQGLTSIIFPNSVESIGEWALLGCSSLDYVVIGKGLKRIEWAVIPPCNDVYCLAEEVPSTDSYVCSTYTGTLHVPKASVDNYKNNNWWSSYFNSIVPLEPGDPGYEDDDIITFADPLVKTICVQYWDTDGDDELSKAEAAAATEAIVGFAFHDKDISSFDEFKYFTGVTTIKTYAFQNCKKLVSITMPNSIKKIEGNAFMDCDLLSSVGFPDNDEFELGFLAFQNCPSLTTMTFPKNLLLNNYGSNPFINCPNLKEILVDESNPKYKSVDGVVYTKNSYTGNEIKVYPNGKELTEYTILDGTTIIDASAFESNKIIQKVNIPNSVTRIENRSFSGCSSLQSVNIPGKVEVINVGAFSNCSSLKSIIIPSSVNGFGSEPFSGCTSLTSIIVESGNTEYDSRDNCNAIIETKTNTLIAGCKTTIIPNTVTTIDYDAFYDQSELTSITIPSSVTSIKSDAFFGCTGLKEVHSLTEEPFTIDESVFRYYDSNWNRQFTSATLYVPKGTKAKYEATDGWKNFTNIVEMDDTPDDGIIAFADANVKAICLANWDTDGDGELSKAEAAAVTDIGLLFYNNQRIKSFNELQYFTGLTAIKQAAFLSNGKMTSVVFPSNLTSIGKFAFSSCAQLQKADLTEGITSISSQAFAGTSITAVVIPSTLTSLDEGVYGLCNDLMSISVKSGNPVYDSRGNCNAVIQTETNKLVQGCNTTVIPKNVTAIGSYAFYTFDGITAVNLPASVTAIGKSAYQGCSKLTTVTIPAAVKSIDEYAFYNCTALNEVYSKINEPMAIDLSVFQTYSSYEGKKFTTATLYVPKGTKSKYKNTAGWKNFKTIVEMNELKGDVNGDMGVDEADIASVISVMAGGTGIPYAQADVNGDGKVDVADIVAIISEMRARARRQEVK